MKTLYLLITIFVLTGALVFSCVMWSKSSAEKKNLDQNAAALQSRIENDKKLNEYSRLMLINMYTDSLNIERKKEGSGLQSIGIIQAKLTDSSYLPAVSAPIVNKDSVYQLNWRLQDSGKGWKSVVTGVTTARNITPPCTTRIIKTEMTFDLITGIKNDRQFARSDNPGLVITGMQGTEIKKTTLPRFGWNIQLSAGYGVHAETGKAGVHAGIDIGYGYRL